MSPNLASGACAHEATYDFDYSQDEPTMLSIAWVSYRHISKATWHTLRTSRPPEWGVFDAPFGIDGVSILAWDYYDELPADLISLCDLIVERGYDHVLIDASGPTVRGLPIYRDWCVDGKDCKADG